MTRGRGIRAAARRLIQLAGLGHAYLNTWWTVAGPAKNLITDWNVQHGAIFIHIPKNAGMAIAETFAMKRAPDTHVPAVGYRAANPRLFDEALTFAVVRNPWDRLVSAFHFVKRSTPFAQDQAWRDANLAHLESFEAFVLALRDPLFRSSVLSYVVFTPQYYYLCDLKGRVIVDRLVRFEALEDGLGQVARDIGMDVDLIRKNSSERAGYQSYYDATTREIVRRIYRRDIDLLGYSFG